MIRKYINKVEDRYVFNVSLIFWHFLILIITLSIVTSAVVLAYSILPSRQKRPKVESYPERPSFPDPVKVSLSELNLTSTSEPSSTPETNITRPAAPTSPAISTSETPGLADYENSMNRLKDLIPPTKYSWSGSGRWDYPYGQRYWDVYRQEHYRRWVVTEVGIESKLDAAFKSSGASSYVDKNSILLTYIRALELLPEDLRINLLQDLLNNPGNSVQHTSAVSEALSNFLSKILITKPIPACIRSLVIFGRRNPNDGSNFINYIASIISKFYDKAQCTAIEHMISSYYNQFNQNLEYQKEATNLFIELLPQIDREVHAKSLSDYYTVYLQKNRSREQQIKEIEAVYAKRVSEIDQKNAMATLKVQEAFQSKISEKQMLLKISVFGLGIGIATIALIALALSFLSIQRSVRRIEQGISGTALDSTNKDD